MWPSDFPPDRRNAFVAVFRVFASTWPKVFATSRVGELLPVWTAALGSVQTDVLEPAAVRYVAEEGSSYPPKPAGFAKFARAVQAQHHGTVAKPAEAAPVPDLPKDAERLDAMGRWAFGQLGTWALVAEAWALLMETAPDADHRAAVRDGSVDREVFREAVHAVQRGKRVMRRGPLADLAGAS
jgi:hypothetical protein